MMPEYEPIIWMLLFFMLKRVIMINWVVHPQYMILSSCSTLYLIYRWTGKALSIRDTEEEMYIHGSKYLRVRSTGYIPCCRGWIEANLAVSVAHGEVFTCFHIW